MTMYQIITRIYPRGRKNRPVNHELHERQMTDYIHAPWYMKPWTSLNTWETR